MEEVVVEAKEHIRWQGLLPGIFADVFLWGENACGGVTESPEQFWITILIVIPLVEYFPGKEDSFRAKRWFGNGISHQLNTTSHDLACSLILKESLIGIHSPSSQLDKLFVA